RRGSAAAVDPALGNRRLALEQDEREPEAEVGAGQDPALNLRAAVHDLHLDGHAEVAQEWVFWVAALVIQEEHRRAVAGGADDCGAVLGGEVVVAFGTPAAEVTHDVEAGSARSDRAGTDHP